MEDDDDGGGITSLLSSSTPTRKSISRTSLDRGQSSDRDLSDRERERRPLYDGHKGYGSTSSLDNFLSPKKINLTPTGKPFNATVLIDPASCKIEHQVQKSDTLEGLAIKYGVTIEEIKRTNKLWSNNSLFARKTITIQLSPETYEKLRQGAEGQISDAQAAKQRLQAKKVTAREEFKRLTDCKEDSVIDFYLETFHFNVDRAVRKFQIDVVAESHRTGSMDPTVIDSSLLLPEDDFIQIRSSGTSLPNGSSLSGYSTYRPQDGYGGYQAAANEQSHLERFYDAKPPRRKEKAKEDLAFSGEYEVHEAIIGDDPEVHHLSPKKQEQLQEDYDKMFDL